MGMACRLGAQLLHTRLGARQAFRRRLHLERKTRGLGGGGNGVKEAPQRQVKGSDRAAGVGRTQPGMGAELCGPNSPAVTTSLDENSTQASSEFLEPQMNLVRENST